MPIEVGAQGQQSNSNNRLHVKQSIYSTQLDSHLADRKHGADPGLLWLEYISDEAEGKAQISVGGLMMDLKPETRTYKNFLLRHLLSV